MAISGVIPTPAPISTMGLVLSPSRVKLPMGSRTSSRSPTPTCSCKYREAAPWALTLMRRWPSDGAQDRL
ncbi:hypothetical protein D3C73_1240240 [compost metagenome]